MEIPILIIINAPANPTGAVPDKTVPKNNDADNMIALNGEREISVYKREKLTIRLNLQGPWVIDVASVLSIFATNEDWITAQT